MWNEYNILKGVNFGDQAVRNPVVIPQLVTAAGDTSYIFAISAIPTSLV